MSTFLRAPRARLFGVALLLFGFALALRFIGLTWGLPNEARWYSLHPDERQVAVAIASLDFFGGDFNPDFYNYPSLFIYLSYFVHGVLALFGFFAPLSPATAQWQLLHDFIFSGRLVSVFLGAATAPVIFLIARAVFPQRPRVAIACGLACALTPGTIQHAHFATVDVAATFFVACALLFAVRAFGTQKTARALLLSAAFAGLAAATKYNAGLVAVAPLCAAWQHRSTVDFDRTLWAKIPIIAIGGFLLGCPGALLYFRDFWGDGQNNGFAYELLVHPRQGSGEIFQNTGNGWIYHGAFNLPFVFTAPALLAALVGLVLAARSKQTRCTPLLVFATLFFISLGFSQVRFMRYVFPLVPVLCVGIGALALLPRRIGHIGVFACITIMAIGAANVLEPVARTDSRDAAATWLKNNAPAGSRIGIFDRPWFWTPPVSRLDAPPGTPPQVLQAALAGNAQLPLVEIPDAVTLQLLQPNFVMISEFETRDKVRLQNATWLELENGLKQNNTVVAQSFSSPTAIPLLPGRAFVPHDYLYTHPRVDIWRRK